MENKKTMKAVTIVEWGKLEYKDMPIPKVSKNLILVKVAYSPINPSDLGTIKGGYPSGMTPPTPGGFEGSGEVVEVGEDLVVPHKVGDKVAFITKAAWAEYTLVESFMASPIISENSLKDAACNFINPGTVYCFLDVLKKQKRTA